MEQNVKIIFSDGTEIDAILNASTYIVDKEPDFPDDLTDVTVEKEDGTIVYHNAKILEAYSDDDKYRFAIIEWPVAG